MARKVIIVAVLAIAICVATAQQQPATTTGTATAPVRAAAPTTTAPAPAAKAPARPELPKNAQGGLEKGLQASVDRASQRAAEDIIKKGGTQAQANAAAEQAGKKVLDAARAGKALPQNVNALTPTDQKRISDAAGKAAAEVAAKGGSQAEANAAGAKASADILAELGLSAGRR